MIVQELWSAVGWAIVNSVY